MMKKNVVLIGMPGSGKSTIGVVLAKKLGYRFMDMDLVIQNQQGMLLRQIIAEQGNKGFMRIESRANEEINTKCTVIAPGGSVVLEPEAMRHLKEIGKVIYLKIGYEELERRLGDLEARGVILEEGTTLRELYDLRTPFYEQYADVVIEEEGKSLYETVETILKLV